FKNDINNFIAWLNAELIDYINEIYQESTTGYYNPQIFDNKILSTNSALMEDLASLGEEMMEIEGFKPLLLSDHYDLDDDYQRAMYLQNVLANRKSTMNDNINMPHEFTKEYGGKLYTIILDNMYFSPTGGFTDAYFIYEEPSEGNTLVFKGENIGFRPDGLVAESRLMLLSDVKIRLSNNMRLLLNGQDEETYVSWDCAGFKEFSFSSGIEFCRNYLTPLDSVTLEPLADEEEHVIGYFKASFLNWGDFVAQVDINHAFYVTGYENLKWKVQNATFDMSDYHSAIFQFPSGYNHQFVGANHQAMPQWKGMHMELLEVTVGGLGDDEFDNPISLGVTDLIVDSRGFTGGVYVAYPFLSLDDGNMGGWAYSIDTIQVDFMANHLKGGGFMGNINVPAFKGKDNPETEKVTEEDCFKYAAHLCSNGDVSFEIHNTNDYTVPMWVADITLRPESHLRLEVRDGNFEAYAMLHGSINMDGQFTEAIHLEIDSIEFQGLEIANTAPYFSPGTWGFPDVSFSMAGFGVSLSDVAIDGTIHSEPAMRFNAGISLSSLPGDDTDENQEKTGLTAEGAFGLFGKLEFENGRQKWKYKDFEVYGITIGCEFKGNKLNGGLMFYEDAVVNGINWGTGFRGGITAEFKILGEVAAVAQFGAIKEPSNPYKYFFVDALVNFASPVALGSSGVALNGFGGGLYYHMSRDTTVAAESIPVNPFEPTVDVFAYGESLSKTLYIPNPDIFIGFKANVILATTAQVVFNANLGFEMAFNSTNADGSGGGIANIYLNGNGRFLELPDYGLPPVKSMGTNPYPGVPLVANAEISYNFNEDLLEGFLEVYMDLVLIRGRYNTKMGRADLRFADDGWFINVGTPDVPLGIDLDLAFPGTESSLLTIGMDAYLNVGTHIAPMKELPDEVKSVSPQFGQGDPFRSTGQGIVFGASLDIQTPDLNVTPFYGNFNAAAGFDMMIRDYGETYCTNLSNTTPVGFNGWYCSGQMYAFVDGEIGLRYNDNNFKILDIGAVAVMRAKLPNPMYAEGYLTGEYSILGGLLSGSCNFRMELGEPCDLSSEPESNDYIVDINPFQGSSAVPVYSAINTRFAVPVTKEFDYQDSKFTFEVVDVSLTKDGLPYFGKTSFNGIGDIFTFEPYEILPERDSFEFSISLRIFENEQLLSTETQSMNFVTATADRKIHAGNVKAAYPKDGMINFYKNQVLVRNVNTARNAEIQLYKNMPNLFNNVPDHLLQKIIISDHEGNEQLVDFEYEIVDQVPTIKYLIDPDYVKNGHIYKIELVSLSKDYVISISNPPIGGSLPGQGGGGSTSVNMSEPQLIAAGPPEEKEVHYESYFRVSQYNNVLDKLEDYKQSIDNENNVVNKEPFSGISIVGDLNTDSWFLEDIYPVLYQPFPDANVNFTHQVHKDTKLPRVTPRFSFMSGDQIAKITKEDFESVDSMMLYADFKLIGTDIVDVIENDLYYVDLQITNYETNTTDPDPIYTGPYLDIQNLEINPPPVLTFDLDCNYYILGRKSTYNWTINLTQ
ncbi:hypothetical protein N9B82_05435, partial [Saprospiraceae bacterium]|nr:hypothetical protein [Saprospiraceae bacterium]